MAKKNFMKSIGNKNLSSLIPTDEPPKEEKKSKPVAIKKKTSAPEPKKTDQTTVTTFRINNDNLLAIKAIAFWDRKKKQDVFNEALELYINSIPASNLKKAISEYKKRQS